MVTDSVEGAMGHIKMHNVKREPQFTGVLPSSVTRPDGNSASLTSPLTFAQTNNILTTVLQTVAVPVTEGTRTITSTRVDTVLVTDTASLQSLQASESKAHETTSTSSAASSTSTTAKADAKNESSNNLSTLIPAIVVPIAVLLIASFAFFWFMMRRRHKKQQKKEPQFVMASKSEKPPISRGNSNSSGHSSTRELVPLSKLEKETAMTTSEVKRSSFDLFPPRPVGSEIGVARPMTPPDKPGSQDLSQDKVYRNFSSVRPGTRNRSGTASSNNRPNQSRDSPARPTRTSPKNSRSGPPPQGRGPMGPPRNPAPRDMSNSRPGTQSPSRGAPVHVNTNMDKGRRAPPPQSLNPPTPTGAFNGASPISQYSPIVKDMPNIGSFTSTEPSNMHGPPPPVAAGHFKGNSRGTDSPTDDSVLSHENMRIARLANSSRLGFNNSPIEPNFPTNNNSRSLAPIASKPSTKVESGATSPQLPPPLTKEHLPIRPFARGPDSPAPGSSIYPSPSIGAGATPRIGGGYSTVSLPHTEHSNGDFMTTTSHQRHISAISRLSSDDGYVDMELDAKSDVSSLDDREKWEMDHERSDLGSQVGARYEGSGYGSAGPSPIDGHNGPSATSAGTGKPNLRDRDSEGPFVLSRY